MLRAAGSTPQAVPITIKAIGSVAQSSLAASRAPMILPMSIIMGEADINISNMHLGRSDKRSIAFMILALDEEVPESVADQVRSYEGMLDVWLVNLDLPQ